VAELGNLTGRILLSPQRMSTVKIRARSLFRTPRSRNGAEGAGFGAGTAVENRYTSPVQVDKTHAGSSFPQRSTTTLTPSQVVHRHLRFRTCREPPFRRRVN
jgi:hypothetical protein